MWSPACFQAASVSASNGARGSLPIGAQRPDPLEGLGPQVERPQRQVQPLGAGVESERAGMAPQPQHGSGQLLTERVWRAQGRSAAGLRLVCGDDSAGRQGFHPGCS